MCHRDFLPMGSAKIINPQKFLLLSQLRDILKYPALESRALMLDMTNKYSEYAGLFITY